MLSASIFVLGMLVPAFTQAMPGTITKGAPGGPMNVTEKELHCIEDMIDAKDPYERQIDWPKTAPYGCANEDAKWYFAKTRNTAGFSGSWLNHDPDHEDSPQKIASGLYQALHQCINKPTKDYGNKNIMSVYYPSGEDKSQYRVRFDRPWFMKTTFQESLEKMQADESRLFGFIQASIDRLQKNKGEFSVTTFIVSSWPPPGTTEDKPPLKPFGNQIGTVEVDKDSVRMSGPKPGECNAGG